MGVKERLRLLDEGGRSNYNKQIIEFSQVLLPEEVRGTLYVTAFPSSFTKDTST